jgi:hypothetical protein
LQRNLGLVGIRRHLGILLARYTGRSDQLTRSIRCEK